MYEKLSGCTGTALTEAEEFRNINWSRVSKSMRAPSWIFDTKGLSNTQEAKEFNINTWTVGEF